MHLGIHTRVQVVALYLAIPPRTFAASGAFTAILASRRDVEEARRRVADDFLLQVSSLPKSIPYSAI